MTVEETGQAMCIALPDIAALLAIARRGALDLLLEPSADVRFIVTDVTECEVNHRALCSDVYAMSIERFFIKCARARQVNVWPTTIGKLALEDIGRRALAGEDASLPPDWVDVSIACFFSSMHTKEPDVPLLVIMSDEWLAGNVCSGRSNSRVVSVSAWLDEMQNGVLNK